MDAQTLPLPQKTKRGGPTNLYLPGDLKLECAQLAQIRYGFSLSELVRRLLQRERALKKGLLKAELKKEEEEAHLARPGLKR